MLETTDPRLELLSKQLRDQIATYRSRQSWHNTFAFWHDVGVTGLGATATALLGLTEISGDLHYQSAIRACVLFITAAITVFVACDHFFRFKTQEQTYRLALGQLLSIERKVAMARTPNQDEVTKFASDFEAAVSKVDPEPEGSIWSSQKRRRLVAVLFAVVALGLALLIYHAARTAREPSPVPARPSQGESRPPQGEK